MGAQGRKFNSCGQSRCPQCDRIDFLFARQESREQKLSEREHQVVWRVDGFLQGVG